MGIPFVRRDAPPRGELLMTGFRRSSLSSAPSVSVAILMLALWGCGGPSAPSKDAASDTKKDGGSAGTGSAGTGGAAGTQGQGGAGAAGSTAGTGAAGSTDGGAGTGAAG